MVWEVFEAVSRGELGGIRAALHTAEANLAWCRVVLPLVSLMPLVPFMAFG